MISIIMISINIRYVAVSRLSSAGHGAWLLGSCSGSVHAAEDKLHRYDQIWMGFRLYQMFRYGWVGRIMFWISSSLNIANDSDQSRQRDLRSVAARFACTLWTLPRDIRAPTARATHHHRYKVDRQTVRSSSQLVDSRESIVDSRCRRRRRTSLTFWQMTIQWSFF